MKQITTACLLALAPAITWANIIPTGVSNSNPFVWVYDFQLSSDQSVRDGIPRVNPVPHTDLRYGAFLTLYDFDGYVGGSCTGPAHWSCSVRNAGYTPDDTMPMDRLDLVNLTWTYVGTTPISGAPNGRSLGTFGAESIYRTETLLDYAARGFKNNGASIGTVTDNVGQTRGPIASPIPEPSSVVLAGLGLALLACFRKGKALR